MFQTGQFGYLQSKIGNLEDSFVRIIINSAENEKQYQYTKYDITSAKPARVEPRQAGSVACDEFIAIDGMHSLEMAPDCAEMIELLNWKVSREDYLHRTVKAMKESQSQSQSRSVNLQLCIEAINEGYSTQECSKSQTSPEECDSEFKNAYAETVFLRHNGFVRDKHVCQTMHGSIMIANALRRNSEPVCIKKMRILEGISPLTIVSESMTERHFLRMGQYLYFVSDLNFGANLAHFVNKCFEYIKEGQLRTSVYRKTVKKLLWDLAMVIKGFHGDNVTALDICSENIFLRNSDFVSKSDGSVAINPEIQCQLVDCGLGHSLAINERYKYYESEEEKGSDSQSKDVYLFGNVCYFAFVFEEIREMEPNYKSVNSLESYFGMHNLLRLLVPKQVNLLQNILTNSEEKRYTKMSTVVRHTYFRRFYKK